MEETKNNLGRTSQKIVFNSIVLTPESAAKLKSLYPGKHNKYFGHHVTLNYGIDEFYPLTGEKIVLTATGIVSDDRGEALLVETDQINFESGRIPHITISTRDDTDPVYSNELAEQASPEAIKHFDLTGHVAAYVSDIGYVFRKPQVVETVFLPTRPQVDTIIALFLLQKFGSLLYPGIEDAIIEIAAVPTTSRTNVLMLDVGKGVYDHHEEGETATYLVAKDLNLLKKPALKKLIDLAERDDKFGKGTISEDMLDRAFGISGLVMALNKNYPNDPTKVVRTIIPLLNAHLEEEIRRTEEIPRLFAELTQKGEVFESRIKHKKKSSRIVALTSDNPSFSGWLRSKGGANADVVIQRHPSGHTNVITRQIKRIDLRRVVVNLRNAEARKLGILLPPLPAYIQSTGRIEEIPAWYYDTATNSILNGGISALDTPVTMLSLSEIIRLVIDGVEDKK